MSAYDNARFLWNDSTGNLMSILAMHVDFIFGGMWSQEKKNIPKLEHMKMEPSNFGH